MRNYYAPSFTRINFVVVPSYIELPCFKRKIGIIYQFVTFFKNFLHPMKAEKNFRVKPLKTDKYLITTWLRTQFII